MSGTSTTSPASRSSRSLGVIFFLILSWLLFAGTASAQYPGRNGKISFIAGFDWKIHTINPDGSQLRSLVGGQDPTECNWGPNGRRLAYVASAGFVESSEVSGIYTVRSDGSSKRLLTPASIQTFDRRDATAPTWAPGGHRLAFIWRAFWKDGSWQSKIEVMNSDGSGIHDVPNTWRAFAPSWSPDGSEIAFLRVYGPNPGIYEIHPDGSGLKLLLPGVYGDGQFNPTMDWSPGGGRIVFGSTGDEEQTDIFILHVRTKLLSDITPTSYFNEVGAAWSPNARRIVFSGGPFGLEPDIWTIRADGSHRRKVADLAGGQDWSPSWQPLVP